MLRQRAIDGLWMDYVVVFAEKTWFGAPERLSMLVFSSACPPSVFASRLEKKTTRCARSNTHMQAPAKGEIMLCLDSQKPFH